MKLRVALVLALAAILSVGAARQLVVGERAIVESDQALRRGDTRSAIAHARLAAESRLPGSPYSRRGFDRLSHIGRDAEARGDARMAAAAWRAVRAAAEETRALGPSNAALTAEANAGLVRAAAAEAPSVPGLADDLARAEGPTSWEILLVAALALALCVGSARFLRSRMFG